MLDPVMEKQFVIKGKKMSVNVSDKAMDFDPRFMMYFITRLPNPSFSPELQAKVMFMRECACRSTVESRKSIRFNGIMPAASPTAWLYFLHVSPP